MGGWAFTAGVLALSGFGLYLGRFIRLNSWEPILTPFRLIEKTLDAIARLVGDFHSQTFVIVAFAFLLGGYLALYALMHLPAITTTELQRCGKLPKTLES